MPTFNATDLFHGLDTASVFDFAAVVNDAHETGTGTDVPSLFALYARHGNDVQIVKLAYATGGTFTLTFSAQTTSALAYNVTAASVQTAFVALSSVGVGNATVGGPDGGPYTITFIGSLSGAAQAAITANGGSLTGGSQTATISVVNDTSGVYDVQTWTLHDVSGGSYHFSFTVNLAGHTPDPFLYQIGPLAYNASAADVQAAFAARFALTPPLSSGGNWPVTVTGDRGGPYTATFGGRFVGFTISTFNINTTDLIGGTPAPTIQVIHRHIGSSDGQSILAQTGTFTEFASPAIAKEYGFGNDQDRSTANALFTPLETGLGVETINLHFQTVETGACVDNASLVWTATDTGTGSVVGVHGPVAFDSGRGHESYTQGKPKRDYGTSVQIGVTIAAISGNETSVHVYETGLVVAAFTKATTGSETDSATPHAILTPAETGTGTSLVALARTIYETGTGTEVGAMAIVVSGHDSSAVSSSYPAIIASVNDTEAGTGSVAGHAGNLFFETQAGTGSNTGLISARITAGTGSIQNLSPNQSGSWFSSAPTQYPGEFGHITEVGVALPVMLATTSGTATEISAIMISFAKTQTGTCTQTPLVLATYSPTETGTATETPLAAVVQSATETGEVVESVWTTADLSKRDTGQWTETVLNTPGRTAFLENKRPSVPIRR